MERLILATAAFIGLAGSSALAQDVPAEARFDVASVKLSSRDRFGGISGGPGSSDPGRIVYSGVTLMQVLLKAYGLQGFQVSGASLLSTSRYEIVANVPPGATQPLFSLMLQDLLMERFGLMAHHETKTLPFYDLTVSSGAFKLKESPDTSNIKMVNGLRPSQMTIGPTENRDGTRITMKSATMSMVTAALEAEFKALVFDKTGLTGFYDFKGDFLGALGPSPGPGLGLPGFSSFPGEFGLKLEKKTGPVEVLVIDHVDQRPTGN